MLDYVPAAYPGRIAPFRTRRQPIFHAHGPATGRGTVADDGVEIDVVPGSHQSMLRDPYVWALAKQLSACLDRAARASGADRFMRRASA